MPHLCGFPHKVAKVLKSFFRVHIFSNIYLCPFNVTREHRLSNRRRKNHKGSELRKMQLKIGNSIYLAKSVKNNNLRGLLFALHSYFLLRTSISAKKILIKNTLGGLFPTKKLGGRFLHKDTWSSLFDYNRIVFKGWDIKISLQLPLCRKVSVHLGPGFWPQLECNMLSTWLHWSLYAMSVQFHMSHVHAQKACGNTYTKETFISIYFFLLL